MFIHVVFLVILTNASIKCTENKRINDVAAEIANKEFTYGFSTSVIWWKTDSQHIDTFINLYKGMVVIISLENIKDKATRFDEAFLNDQVVIYVVNVYEFNEILTIINRQRIKPIHVILVIMETDDINIKMLEFTRTAWENDVADIIIISANVKNETFLNTFIPYSDGRCGDYTPVVVNINQPKLFTSKFHNFHKCPVRMKASILPPYVMHEKQNNTIKSLRGFDTDVMKFILQRLNATVTILSDIQINNSMLNFANISQSENLGDLINNVADVAIPGYVINERRYSVAQAFYAYYHIPVVWCVPSQREIYAWAKVILPFLSSTTPLIVLSFVAFQACVKLVHRFGRFTKRGNNDSLVKSFALFLGQEVKFESKYWLNNLVFMIWIWYCCIMRIAYQGDLINGLHRVILEPPIKTLSDALQSLDEVVGVPALLDLYRNTTVEKRFKPLKNNDIWFYLDKISNGERILQAANEVLIKYTKHNVQILDERVCVFKVYFFVRPRWAASVELHRTMMRITEVGFQVQISQTYVMEFLRASDYFDPEENDDNALNMITLSSCFYGLLASYIVCFFIFCLEIVWFNISKKSLARNVA